MLGYYGQAPGYWSPTYGIPYHVYSPPVNPYTYNTGYGIPYVPLYSTPLCQPQFGIGYGTRFGRGRGMGRGRCRC